MGKVKIKRKSTLIDMTAMSDVTVLLLTYVDIYILAKGANHGDYAFVGIGNQSTHSQLGYGACLPERQRVHLIGRRQGLDILEREHARRTYQECSRRI